MRFTFALMSLAGILLTIYGGLLYWPDKPKIDTVNFGGDRTAAKNFRAFSHAWWKTHEAGQRDWHYQNDFQFQNKRNFWLTTRYQEEILENGTLFTHVIPVLKKFPEHPGVKNTYIYKSHFPRLGPVYVQAGQYKVKFVTEFKDKISEVSNKKIKNHWHYWKIDDIQNYEDIEIPDTLEFCALGVFCQLPTPASHF